MIGVIVQPAYLPWRGFFDLMKRADVFVFYDDVQYDKHGWRNRNRFKTSQGTQWLTVPVLSKGNVEEGLLLRDVKIAPNVDWARKHRTSIKQSYARAPFFTKYQPLVDSLLGTPYERLVNLTIDSTMKLAKELGLEKRCLRSSELSIPGRKTERLVAILKSLGVDHYLSGPSARDYIDERLFAEARIGLEYIVYDYPPYEQLHGDYDPQVSILDLLFMKGPETPRYIWPNDAR